MPLSTPFRSTDTSPAATIPTDAVHSDEFIARRKSAVDFHVSAARAAIMALRGFGEHELVAAMLDEELAETRIEATSIAARSAKGTRKAGQPVRLVAGERGA